MSNELRTKHGCSGRGPTVLSRSIVRKVSQGGPPLQSSPLAEGGITGWAQVHGWRGGTSIEKRLEHDLNYVQNRSFAFDLRIGAMTVLSALTNKNAY
jgi:putative colanic acid biosynthesis UDP-glucose lipid carrier transferase